MKTLEIKVEGVTPILLHSAASMEVQKTKTARQQRLSPEEQAKQSVYWCDDGSLGFPVANAIRSMLRGAAGAKFGKRSIVPYLAGSVIPAEEMASFGTKNYIVDKRPVVVQRQRVIRGRGRLDKWVLTFRLLVDDEVLPADDVAEIIPVAFEEAGRRVGLGDYRPEKGGSFGRFKVVSHRWI